MPGLTMTLMNPPKGSKKKKARRRKSSAKQIAWRKKFAAMFGGKKKAARKTKRRKARTSTKARTGAPPMASRKKRRRRARKSNPPTGLRVSRRRRRRARRSNPPTGLSLRSAFTVNGILGTLKKAAPQVALGALGFLLTPKLADMIPAKFLADKAGGVSPWKRLLAKTGIGLSMLVAGTLAKQTSFAAAALIGSLINVAVDAAQRYGPANLMPKALMGMGDNGDYVDASDAASLGLGRSLLVGRQPAMTSNGRAVSVPG